MFGDFFFVEKVFPTARVVQQAEYVQECGFAAARWSHDGDKFAFVNIYVDIVQSRGFHFFGGIDFLEVDGFDHCETPL